MRYDLVAVVAARRGITQLREMVAQLPREFGMPVVFIGNGGASSGGFILAEGGINWRVNANIVRLALRYAF